MKTVSNKNEKAITEQTAHTLQTNSHLMSEITNHVDTSSALLRLQASFMITAFYPLTPSSITGQERKEQPWRSDRRSSLSDRSENRICRRVETNTPTSSLQDCKHTSLSLFITGWLPDSRACAVWGFLHFLIEINLKPQNLNKSFCCCLTSATPHPVTSAQKINAHS